MSKTITVVGLIWLLGIMYAYSSSINNIAFAIKTVIISMIFGPVLIYLEKQI